MTLRYARFLDPDGRPRIGCLSDDACLQPLVGDLFGQTRADGAPVPRAAVRLLAPVRPGKIVAVASNYRRHAAEMGKTIPPVPKLFIKPATAVIGPDEAIELPPGTARVDHEAELAVVIGRTMKRVSRADALAHVLGYTCLNDVTARDLQRADGQFTRGKGFDTFCPLGPFIATGLDPADRRIRCWVDGVLRQDGHSSDMAADVPMLLEFISGGMTLLPGDVVATGTPSGVGPLLAGQVVEIEIDGIGRLRNPVVNRDDRDA